MWFGTSFLFQLLIFVFTEIEGKGDSEIENLSPLLINIFDNDSLLCILVNNF